MQEPSNTPPNKPGTPQQQVPEGQYFSKGIALGLALGVGIGVALGNVGIGPAIGVAFGAGIGSAWEAKAKKEGKVRPMTPEERARVKKNSKWGLIAGVILFVIVLGLYLLR